MMPKVEGMNLSPTVVVNFGISEEFPNQTLLSEVSLAYPPGNFIFSMRIFFELFWGGILWNSWDVPHIHGMLAAIPTVLVDWQLGV